MKIILQNLTLSEAVVKIKRCGYAQLLDAKTGQISFVRRLSGYQYPRFHIYLGEDKRGQLFYNLHLDQKKPSYKGARAHSGEYEGEVIEQEVARLKKLIG